MNLTLCFWGIVVIFKRSNTQQIVLLKPRLQISLAVQHLNKSSVGPNSLKGFSWEQD